MNNIQIQAQTCLKCGHAWFPRTQTRPRVCPKCHSPYWQNYGKIGNQKHEELVAKYAEEYENKGCKVIEATVLPDLIIINWMERTVTAVEVETNKLRIQTKLKRYRERQPNFDYLIINGNTQDFKQ